MSTRMDVLKRNLEDERAFVRAYREAWEGEVRARLRDLSPVDRLHLAADAALLLSTFYVEYDNKGNPKNV